MTSRQEALQDLASLRPHLDDIRHRARLACAISPVHWLAVHGVPLNTYLAEVDKLDALCAKAEEELAGK